MAKSKRRVGRPCKAPYKHINCRISAHSLEVLEQYANSKNTTKTAVIESKMARYFKDSEVRQFIKVNIKDKTGSSRVNFDIKLDQTLVAKLEEYCVKHYPLTKTSFLEQLIERRCKLK